MSDRAPRDGGAEESDTGPIAVPGSSSAADTGPVPLADPGGEPETTPGWAPPPGSAAAPRGAGSVAPHPGAEQVRPRAALRPAAPGIPPVPQRPARAARTPRSAEATAFVLHQFPIGHMPVSASAPARQRAVDEDTGQRALRTTWSAERQPVAPPPGRGIGPEAPGRLGAGIALPAELSAGCGPDGELGAQDGGRASRASEGGCVWPAPAPSGSSEPLPEGAEVDLLGTPLRRVVFAAGTPFAERAQPPEYRGRSYRRFRVRRAVPVVRDEARAWFGQPGGGTRYVLPCSVVELVASGHLVEVTGGARGGTDPSAAAGAVSEVAVRPGGEAAPPGGAAAGGGGDGGVRAAAAGARGAAEVPDGAGSPERADTRGRAAGSSAPLDAPTASTGVRFGREESDGQEAR